MNTSATSYIFEWIDSLITKVVNPDLNRLVRLDDGEMEELSLKLLEESVRLKSQIRNQLFTITKHNKKMILVSQYHSTLTLLFNQILRYKKENLNSENHFEKIFLLIQASLEELLTFIESHYATHINPAEKVSVNCYDAIKEEVKGRLSRLKTGLNEEQLQNPTIEIVLKRLQKFTESDFSGHRSSYRTIFYKKDLMKGLEELQWNAATHEEFSQLDKLLIYLNFNSKAYIKLLIASLKEKADESANTMEKLSKLQFYQKAFKQIHPKPKTILNPHYYSLNLIINNWFKQEIGYLKETIYMGSEHWSVKTPGKLGKEQSSKARQKIKCELSSDQIALILKAADESKLLVASSLSEVFKTIVPFLSTPKKEELSPNAMRVRTYNIEDRDKEIAIESLQLLITKIKQY